MIICRMRNGYEIKDQEGRRDDSHFSSFTVSTRISLVDYPRFCIILTVLFGMVFPFVFRHKSQEFSLIYQICKESQELSQQKERQRENHPLSSGRMRGTYTLVERTGGQNEIILIYLYPFAKCTLGFWMRDGWRRRE